MNKQREFQFSPKSMLVSRQRQGFPRDKGIGLVLSVYTSQTFTSGCDATRDKKRLPLLVRPKCDKFRLNCVSRDSFRLPSGPSSFSTTLKRDESSIEPGWRQVQTRLCDDWVMGCWVGVIRKLETNKGFGWNHALMAQTKCDDSRPIEKNK